MLLYAHSITPRLKYVADFLTRYYGHPFKVMANETAYLDSTDPRINYSHQRMSDGELYIKPSPLLSESEKRRFNLHAVAHNGYKVIFESNCDLGFDLFAGIFYLLTRYEEYLPHAKDAYGRFAHEASLAFREEFLHLPLINIWLEDFRTVLEERFPGIELQKPQFSFEPTYDIDLAWAFKFKPFKVRWGRILNHIFRLKFGQARRHIKVLKGKIQDPYDSYEWLDELHRQHNLQPVYFILAAIEKGKYDKNADVHLPQFHQLVHALGSQYTLGMHPSWYSGDHKAALAKEKAVVEKASHQHLHHSRQHYIRMQMPQTYHHLQDLGIQHEYSMGYGTINGFRASVATPYYWYDLEKEQQTNLLIHPFCFMDATAYYQQKQTPEETLAELRELLKTIRSVGGTMSTVWHNHLLGTAPEFEGWREVYAQFVAETGM
ncbi:hypothetical protein SAMN05444008_11035 [Cnuella takakiae]|uniref:DUF7033 domain-containing protein n=1 Tax=Cnuella takakiae TaxID=1302690 RepID=A0A1M5D1U3_9BACT|nr:polysaccharide deacetylase family protein [Cnuella takakiae]OLY94141.1 hypothetical protein BUE76_21295 [Cnuella takakiae]SHF60787.1 hypothetical protein SAMN05444008_11035 [Cnuella takakiae]